jgi:hypothetical protein
VCVCMCVCMCVCVCVCVCVSLSVVHATLPLPFPSLPFPPFHPHRILATGSSQPNVGLRRRGDRAFPDSIFNVSLPFSFNRCRYYYLSGLCRQLLIEMPCAFFSLPIVIVIEKKKKNQDARLANIWPTTVLFFS